MFCNGSSSQKDIFVLYSAASYVKKGPIYSGNYLQNTEFRVGSHNINTGSAPLDTVSEPPRSHRGEWSRRTIWPTFSLFLECICQSISLFRPMAADKIIPHYTAHRQCGSQSSGATIIIVRYEEQVLLLGDMILTARSNQSCICTYHIVHFSVSKACRNTMVPLIHTEGQYIT